MKKVIETKHYPDAGITVLRAPRDQGDGDIRFIVRMECCGRVQKMSRSNVLERLRTGAAYRELNGYATPCTSCSKTVGKYRSPVRPNGKRKTTDLEPIFQQIKVPSWDTCLPVGMSRPGDRGYKIWSDGCK